MHAGYHNSASLARNVEMGSGTSLKVVQSNYTNELARIEEEKVSNIVEICNVSRDEALRVLDACHKDETMAIERFLNGAEVSTWSQVSKKKRQPTNTRSNSGPRTGSVAGRAYDRDRDDDGDRRDRQRLSSFPSHHANPHNGHRRGSKHHGHAQHGKDHSASVQRKRPSHPTSKVSSPPNSTLRQEQPDVWTEPSIDEGLADHSTTVVPVESWSESRTASPNAWTDRTAVVANQERPNGAWSVAGHKRQSPSSLWPLQSDDSVSKESDPATGHITTVPRTGQSIESPSRQQGNSLPTTKRSFNYAAAAASGTSHEKAVSPSHENSVQVATETSGRSKSPVSEISAADSQEDAGVGEVTSTVNETHQNHRTLNLQSRAEGQRQPINGNVETKQSPEAHSELFDSESDRKPEVLSSDRGSHTSAWGAASLHPKETEKTSSKRLPNTTASLVATSTGVADGEQGRGDSLSLQFGSFGLSGLDGVNWSPSERKSPEAVVNTLVAAENASIEPSSAMALQVSSAQAIRGSPIAQETGTGEASSTPMPSSSSISIPRSASKVENSSAHTSSSAPKPANSSSGGSGVVPVLPVGPGGSFTHANYGTPYLMPPLHGYSPAMTSYENGADLGSSRASSLVQPGSLPMYDPTTITGVPTANGKYGGIPGLGDVSGLQGIQSSISKDGHQGPAGEQEKASSVTTSGLPAGMDALAPPYMMQGYPSMQYPMYTFPTGPYAPPGIAPPGPSPFPYPPPGQVSSQGGRAGFGFEDTPVGLTGSSRAGATVGESMYTPGYLNTSMNHSSSQKGSNDVSFKPMRGSGLGGASIGGGMVPGVAYSDFPGGMPIVSGGIGTTAGMPGNWNTSRPHSVNRTEPGNGPSIGSNQGMTAASASSSVYTAAAPGTHGGYWGPQQGGYYQ